MTGPASAVDDAMAQALQAQLAPHAYLDGWRGRYAPAADANALPSSTLGDTLGVAHTAAQAESDGTRPEPVRAPAGASGAVQTAEAERAARPKPVAPALTHRQREAARLKALQMTAERKRLRARLQAGELTLEQALAQDGEAARGMRVATVVRALPGIGAATAAQLLREAGIDPSRRAGGLTTGQRERLVDAELAARHSHPRHDSGQVPITLTAK